MMVCVETGTEAVELGVGVELAEDCVLLRVVDDLVVELAVVEEAVVELPPPPPPFVVLAPPPPESSVLLPVDDGLLV